MTTVADRLPRVHEQAAKRHLGDRHGEQEHRVGAIDERERGHEDEESQIAPVGRRIDRPREISRVKDRDQEIAQRIFEARRCVVDERLGAEKPQRQKHGRTDGRRAAQQDDPGGHVEDPRQRRDREEELAGQQVGGRDGHHPERVGVGLDALVRVVGQAVAVDEIPHRPEGDVGVVAHPVVGEEDVGEKD